ncbi:MAG: hypothetical protein LBH13_10225 [Cellulomonadaceae bacterium]|jgi:uncharacterized protein YPO0396|nr:hypothetical protein [Cellulomonadaceae bacterium]
MTMIDTLFGLIPSASTGQQWIARELQVVNWGGYGGHHRVKLASTATLFAGASGSGKSTLMDAYIALLMPHTTPFNGASNGGVVGRPRGKDQRNIISYSRGKVDESRTESGTKERVLRGDGQDTWTAVAMTWVDQAGTEFTGLRAWYVPSGASSMESVVTVRATVDGGFALSTLEEAATARFGRTALTAAGLTCFDTDREFSARLFSTLGIGAAGGGEKAAGLLARIQAGQQITTVDKLYKDMVLTEPDTYAKADDVIDHFDELSGTREHMLTAKAQVQALAPIRGHRASVDESRQRLEVIAALGSADDDGSLVGLWRADKRAGLLRAVEDDVRRRSREAAERVRELDAAVGARKSELEGVRQTLWNSGGAKIQNAERELSASEARVAEVRRSRSRLDGALAVLRVEISTEAEFDRCASASRARLASTDARHAAFVSRDEARDAQREAERTLASLTAERDALAKRRGNVPESLHRARLALAQAAGLRAEELPFVAELVEVSTQYEPWREAFNLALGGFARTLLVDVAHLAAFRAAIDSVTSSVRLQFRGVPTGRRIDSHPNTGTLPGRLDYASGPFEGWLRDHLADQFAYVCVDTPAQLSQHPLALTRAGQTSSRSGGAHGGHGRANLLGFTNSRRISELDREIETARSGLTGAAEAFRGAELRLSAVEEQAVASRTVVDLTWNDVDVVGAEAACERWRNVISEARADNPQWGELEARATELDGEVTRLQREWGAAEAESRDLADHWEKVTDQVDAAQEVLDAAEDAERVVTDSQREYLDSLTEAEPSSLRHSSSGRLSQAAQPTTGETPASRHSAGVAESRHSAGEASQNLSSAHFEPPTETPAEALAHFDAAVARLSERLRHDRETAETAVTASTDALRVTFEQFVSRWQDPNLGTDPDASYSDFEAVLTRLETERLHELEAEWRRALLRLSGADLTDLEHTMSRSIREITDRIGPVNAILDSLPFADDEHRLHITVSRPTSASQKRFRNELRAVREMLASGTDVSNDERERRYLRMARLMERIRPGSPERVDLIDVRRHVRLSAEKITADDGTHVALYDHIGEKSGGESQELVAFIVGAALRYQLGDAGAERPRYAPVFLDEALIKADAQFSGRALGAWRGLGFQLIVGAPNDKVSALEPHVDASYVIVKNAAGLSRAHPIVGVEPSGTEGG